eukprot:scaffold219203_cov46-Cyclotella_meneghiniana.AAC.1
MQNTLKVFQIDIRPPAFINKHNDILFQFARVRTQVQTIDKCTATASSVIVCAPPLSSFFDVLLPFCLPLLTPLLMGFIYRGALLVSKVLRSVEAVRRQCGLEAERQRYSRVEGRIKRNTIQET